MISLPFQGRQLGIGDAAVEDADQIQIGNHFWLRTDGDAFDYRGTVAAKSQRTNELSPNSIRTLDGEECEGRGKHCASLEEFMAQERGVETPLSLAAQREAAATTYLTTTPRAMQSVDGLEAAMDAVAPAEEDMED